MINEETKKQISYFEYQQFDDDQESNEDNDE
jgi:hypothetical protein